MQNNIITFTQNGLQSQNPGNKQRPKDNKHSQGSFGIIQPKERHGM